MVRKKTIHGWKVVVYTKDYYAFKRGKKTAVFARGTRWHSPFVGRLYKDKKHIATETEIYNPFDIGGILKKWRYR